jgi:hypothetical protein
MGRAGVNILKQRVSGCLDQAVSSNRIVGGVVLVDRAGEVVETAGGLVDREESRR